MPAIHLDIKKLSRSGFLVGAGIVYGNIGTTLLYTFKAIIQQEPVNSAPGSGSVTAIFPTFFLKGRRYLNRTIY